MYTFEDIQKYLKDHVESLVDYVSNANTGTAHSPTGHPYQEWAIGVRSIDPSQLMHKAKLLAQSIETYYGLGPEKLVLPLDYGAQIEYRAPNKRTVLYWRCFPEAGEVPVEPEEALLGDQPSLSRVYLRFTIV